MSDNVKKLKALAADSIAKAKAIKDSYEVGQNMSQEDHDAFNGFMKRYDELLVQIEAEEKMSKADEYLKAPAGTQAAHLGWRESAPDEGNVPVDGKSWREVDYKVFVPGRGMETRSLRFNVPIAVEKKDYGNAFEAYLRKGRANVGPEDYKTLQEATDPSGGYLVPADYHEELIKKVAAMATVRQNARVAQTSRDVAQWPKITYTDDDLYTSGVRLTWSGSETPSSTSHRVTDPVFGMYNVPVNTAMASMPVSLNLIEDSAFDVLGIGAELFAEAFALGENNAFWNGTGSAEPRGLVTSVSSDTDVGADEIEYVGSGTASVIGAADIFSLWEALPSQYEMNAKWYFEKATESDIRQLADTDGNYFWPVWPQVGGFGEHPRELLGFPTLRDEFVPSVGSGLLPLFFGDMRAYLVLDRVGLSIQRVSEPYVESNYLVLLGRKRVGGQVIEPWRMKALKTLAST